MKSIFLGVVACVSLVAGASPALSADVFHSTWSGQTAAPSADATNPSVFDLSGVSSSDTPKADRFADLLRIAEAPAITIAPSVSRVVLTSQTIRKVGYGRVESIEIVTTPSGVYSSDGLASAHVLYPGIEVGPTASEGFATLFALIGSNWAPLRVIPAGSFVEFGSGYGTSFETDGRTTCLSGSNFRGCI